MSRTEIQTNAGKITIATVLSLIGAMTLAFLFDVSSGGTIETVSADDATTTVTVLNIPPIWTQDAQELFASATNTPTNVGSTTVWTAIGTDANAEDYYLLICGGTSTSPNAGSPPNCGTATQIGVSALTNSGITATVTRTALVSDPEETDWVGWICDTNAGQPSCNASSTGQSPGNVNGTSSPFVVNHAHNATVVADDSPALPGNVVTWTSTASDGTDVLRGAGADELQLFICQTNGFDASIPGCTGGTWATSTLSSTNPTATTTIALGTADRNYDAYAFFIDEFGLIATGVAHGSNTTLNVANATPTVQSVDLGDTSNQLVLTVPQGETTGLQLSYVIDDDNGCQNASSSDEVVDQEVFVYVTGATTLAGCDTSAEYDPNGCYPSYLSTTTWNINCTASSTTCSGGTDTNMQFDCTFPMWFVANPTDAGSVLAADDWSASVVAIDDDGGYSATTTTGVPQRAELIQFLSFTATANSASGTIAYGSLQPGQNTGTLSATTTLTVTGNTGIDQQVLGDDMCITYPTCTGNATNTIVVANQEYALTGVAYGAGTDLTTATSATIDVSIAKNTSTSTLNSDDTHWGIEVPATIEIAGDYIGINTIVGVVAPSGDW